MRASSRFLTAAGIGLAVVLGVNGCGAAKQLSAKDSVSTAMTGFENARSASFVVSLKSTPADIKAISAATGDPVATSEERGIGYLLAGDVVFTAVAPEGKTFAEAAQQSAASSQRDLTSLLRDPAALAAYLKRQGAFSMAVRLSGTSLVEFRSVGGVIYARADVPKIVKLAGQDQAQVDAAVQDLPASFAPLAKAAKGEWISLDLAKAAKAAKNSGLLDRLATPAPTASVDSATLAKLLSDLKAAYRQNARITKLDSGEAGDHYRLSAPARQVGLAVQDDLISLIGQSSAAEIRKDVARIPDKTYTIDLWVKNDTLTRVDVDLTQFIDKAPKDAELTLDILVTVGSGTVEAPAKANELDVASLLSSLPGGLGGLGGLGA